MGGRRSLLLLLPFYAYIYDHFFWTYHWLYKVIHICEAYTLSNPVVSDIVPISYIGGTGGGRKIVYRFYVISNQSYWSSKNRARELCTHVQKITIQYQTQRTEQGNHRSLHPDLTLPNERNAFLQTLSISSTYIPNPVPCIIYWRRIAT